MVWVQGSRVWDVPSKVAIDQRSRSVRLAAKRATFGPLRLDHLLFRMPDGWRAEVRRADSKYGSDHYPLVATVDIR